jgi:hypothetical protein
MFAVLNTDTLTTKIMMDWKLIIKFHIIFAQILRAWQKNLSHIELLNNLKFIELKHTRQEIKK